MPDSSPPDEAAEAPTLQHYDAFMRTIMTRRWGDRLTARMDALGVSSSELSRSTGVSVTTITLLRQGKRMPGEAIRLAISVQLGADVEQVFPNPLLQDYLDFLHHFGAEVIEPEPAEVAA